ncbi:protein kinase domain-containing protein [Actinospica sp.]|jgi:serine/threonine protein kinase|uniref:protein kinase domain-containing protein n=1 Tax=Actinospica sp. TaxID=1872142 RepID=UPI002CEB71B1|nr:protein kinase [Actinospica sp.]HWG28836.1 protein kinase [Actinospica sp.]
MEALTAQDPARIGPFRLVARLGRGGMGRVYLGRDEGSGRHAAVKTIHGELAADPEFRTRFTQEVNAALRVRDEYIAEVVLADPAAAVPWLATAYVPGISVEDAVRKYGPMSADSVRMLGVCVSRAVAAIHAVGLVHRDLKPGNVLLTAQGPKVIDFGIARGVGDEGLTKTGMVAGSPPYMAPEQLVTGEFGPASDVFSLGAILHYAATAAGPYGRGGAQELYARALAVGPTVAPDLADAIAVPVSHALSREPGSRPSAAELVAELELEPGEKPAPGWLPGNVTQEILTQATEALTTASAAFDRLPPPGPQQPQAPTFAPPFPQPQSGPPSHPSNPQNPTFGPPPVSSSPHNQFGPPSNPSNPSNPRNPTFAPPNSQPNRPLGPPQQMFQQPQGYPQTPPRQTPVPPQPQQRPFPPQQGGSYGPRPGTAPQGTGYRYPQAPQPQYPQSNGMGTAGLTLGIIGLFLPCLLIFGIIFSGIGLSRAGQGQPSGTSKAGLIVSLVGLLGWILLIVFAVTHATSS